MALLENNWLNARWVFYFGPAFVICVHIGETKYYINAVIMLSQTPSPTLSVSGAEPWLTLQGLCSLRVLSHAERKTRKKEKKVQGSQNEQRAKLKCRFTRKQSRKRCSWTFGLQVRPLTPLAWSVKWKSVCTLVPVVNHGWRGGAQRGCWSCCISQKWTVSSSKNNLKMILNSLYWCSGTCFCRHVPPPAPIGNLELADQAATNLICLLKWNGTLAGQ